MVNLYIVLDTLILHIVRDHCKIAILAYRVCVVSLCPEVPSPEFVLHVGMCSEDMKRFLLWGFRMWFGFTSSDYQPASPLQAGGERLIHYPFTIRSVCKRVIGNSNRGWKENTKREHSRPTQEGNGENIANPRRPGG